MLGRRGVRATAADELPPPPPPEEDDSSPPPPPPSDSEDEDWPGPPPDTESDAPPPPDTDSDAPPPAWGDPANSNDGRLGQQQEPAYAPEPEQPAYVAYEPAYQYHAPAPVPAEAALPAEAGLPEGTREELQLTADDRDGFGLDLDGWMNVENVAGPAARAGWQPGWVIVGVQGREVRSKEEMLQELQGAGRTVQFSVFIPAALQPADGGGAETDTVAHAVDEFHRHDEDESATLDQAETLRLLQARGMAVDEAWVAGIWDAIDMDGSGLLDMNEFLGLLRLAAPASERRSARASAGPSAAELAEQNAAAVRVQSRFRMRSQRNAFRTQLRATREREAARERAWAIYNRGGPAQGLSDGDGESGEFAMAHQPRSPAVHSSLTQQRAHAATTLQAAYRGRTARRGLKMGLIGRPDTRAAQAAAFKQEQLRSHAPAHYAHLAELESTARRLKAELQHGAGGVEASGDDVPVDVEQLIRRNQELEERVHQLESSRARQRGLAQASHALESGGAALPARRAPGSSPSSSRGWREAWDPEHNRRYYYNKYTKEVTWEMPEGFSRKSRSRGARHGLRKVYMPPSTQAGQF